MFRFIYLSILFSALSLSVPSANAAITKRGVIEFNAGVNNFKQKKYRSAIKYFIRASKLGMRKSSLNYNLGVSYYRIGKYEKSARYFKKLKDVKNFQQISNYNLGLIAEKRSRKNAAIKYYKNATNYNERKKITILANNQLDRLLKRHKLRATTASISLSIGNDDNITNATLNSPSNKGDTFEELFASFKTPLNENMNVKGSLLWLNYNNISTEDFIFYTAALDYNVKMKDWKITPEISLLQSTLNGNSYQNVSNLRVTGKHALSKNSKILLRYRYSNIRMLNAAFNYLQGDRHQFRIDYKKRINSSRLRLRYQLESNQRQNSTTANYSPVRHTFRARYKHKLNNKWRLSEEIGFRISQYGAASSTTRNDQRLRLRISARTKLSQKWNGGIRYSHTNNTSNKASEDYSRNIIQFIASRDF